MAVYNMKLVIFYLTNQERHFTFEHYVRMINESRLKNLWEIIILANNDNLDFYKGILNNTDIQHSEFLFAPDNNYLNKVNFAIQYAKERHIPYMMKCDNDVFIRGRTLDYMIDNLEALNDPKNLTIGPELSSGIPCVEYFSDDFLNETERAELQKRFLQTELTDIWGATYTHHNRFTTGATKWDGMGFFADVKKNAHHYKGIHPVRVNISAQQYLNSCIINNKGKFYENRDLSIIRDDTSPYLCNTIFCIRTDIYDKIVTDQSLYVDPFDEVPVNKYAWNNSAAHLFVRNGFGIHMCYNTIPNNRSYEFDFCSKFF